jgi:hypothetical protein
VSWSATPAAYATRSTTWSDHIGPNWVAAAAPKSCPIRPVMASVFWPSAASAAWTKLSSPRIRLRIRSAARIECCPSSACNRMA